MGCGSSVLTWLQQQPLHGYVEQPLEPLVLLLGAQDLALVLRHRVLHGAEDLLGGRGEPVGEEHVQQVQAAHVGSPQRIVLFTSTNLETQGRRLVRGPVPSARAHSLELCDAACWTGDHSTPHCRAPEAQHRLYLLHDGLTCDHRDPLLLLLPAGGGEQVDDVSSASEEVKYNHLDLYF